MNFHRVKINDICRFWSFVTRKGPEECWMWKSQPGRNYGNFSVGKKNILPHRFSYLIHNKELPDGLLVLHSCDNTFCVNPAHLFAGTQLQNRQDCVAKGRQARGVEHGRSILTPAEVVIIREKKERNPELTDRQLGEEFHVSPGCINHIIRRESWAWL